MTAVTEVNDPQPDQPINPWTLKEAVFEVMPEAEEAAGAPTWSLAPEWPGPICRLCWPPVGDDMKPVVEESKQLRARLAKIDNEYDEGIIDGRRSRSAKENVQAKLGEIDKKRATRKGGAALGKIAESPDPAQAFREASLMAQRAVIDASVHRPAFPSPGPVEA
jgi:hypothetical protein